MLILLWLLLAPASIVEVRHGLNPAALPCRDCLTTITGSRFALAPVGSISAPRYEMSGVRVWVDDKPQLIRLVDATRVDFLLDASKGFKHQLLVRTQFDEYLTAWFSVGEAWPGVFISGEPAAGARNVPTGLWTPDNGRSVFPLTIAPVPVGSPDRPTLVLLLGTGWRHARLLAVQLGGIPCRLVAASPAPAFPGVDQLVFEVPYYLADNEGLDLVILAGYRASNPARIYLGL